MDKPTIIGYYGSSKTIESKRWMVGHARHRENGPAIICYSRDGNVILEIWLINDRYHRIDGPAYIEYYENGDVKEELWHMYEKEINPPYKKYPLTKEQIVEMKLTYG